MASDREQIIEETIGILVEELRCGDVSEKQLEKLLRQRSKELTDPSNRLSKGELLSIHLRERDSDVWDGIEPEVDEALVKLLRSKPRRTASGVATVTVLMKPWPCGGDCICCPNDIRMPKSYLSDEPACQRAERWWFDPYLQVASRIRVLEDMGHATDKVELIVLGGTFDDYPSDYRTWFIEQLFECLDDFGSDGFEEKVQARISEYEVDPDRMPFGSSEEIAQIQACVDAGEIGYNEAVTAMNADPLRQRLARSQTCSAEELLDVQRRNETAAHRVVGLCVETRPELVTPHSLASLRMLGCTKLQVGVQSLDPDRLSRMGRANGLDEIERAFDLMRLFGFKSHVHMMANLPGATPDSDAREYEELVTDARFLPDEVKLYPCALVESSHLTEGFESGSWQPYGEEELIDLLAKDLLATPSHTRISRMIRDISSKDILSGNRKTNLRQLVELEAERRIDDSDASSDLSARTHPTIQEIRHREISTDDIDPESLEMDEVFYAMSNTQEVFLQYVDPAGRIAAFCRLSMPDQDAVSELRREWDASSSASDASPDDPCIATNASEPCPIRMDEAMIREVHVYGRVSRLHEANEGSQHIGLGRSLIARACDIARESGFASIAVISSVGTREYYARLGFELGDMYQRKSLGAARP